MLNTRPMSTDRGMEGNTAGADRDQVVSSDAIERASAILGLIGVAVIHFSQVIVTIEQTVWLGISFAALTMFCVVLAARLLHRRTLGVWAQIAMLNMAAIGGYVFTRMVSTGFDNQDVGNWSESLGLAALLVEALLVALCVYTLVRSTTRSAG